MLTAPDFPREIAFWNIISIASGMTVAPANNFVNKLSTANLTTKIETARMRVEHKTIQTIDLLDILR